MRRLVHFLQVRKQAPGQQHPIVKAIIITDKDAVKIPETLLCKKRPIPIYIISIEVTFIDETQVLFEYLKEKLPRLKG